MNLTDESTGMSHGTASGGGDTDLSWIPDIAARLAPAGWSKKIDQFHPIAPYNNPDFLDSENIAEQIVSGGRGMGKSTLLMYRVRHLRNTHQLVRAVPPFGFRLVANSIPVPQKAYWHFRSIEPWVATWKLVLGALFAFAIKRSLDPNLATTRKPEDWLAVFNADPNNEPTFCELVKHVQTWGQSPHDECVADLILTVLKSQMRVERLTALYKQKIKPILSARNPSGKNEASWIFYVDGIDEAISNFEERSLLAKDAALKYIDEQDITEQNAYVVGQQVWKCSQAGFAHAAFQLREETTAQLLAFGSIRDETYNEFLNRSLTDTKVEHFVLGLRYPESMLREMFNYNVSLMPQRLPLPKPHDLDKHQQAAHVFCGYTLLFSRDVFGHVEDPYSLLRRHSFGTPRGLMFLGGKVRDIRPTERWDGVAGLWRDPEEVIAAVVNRSRVVLDEHLKTLFPPWDTTYEQGLSLLEHDVLTAAEANRIEEEFTHLHGKREVPFFKYLFECGLVGVPGGKTIGSGCIQKFVTANQPDKTFTEAYPYVMLHPALSAKVRTLLSTEKRHAFYNGRLVVNPGSFCPPTLPPTCIRVDCQRQRIVAYIPGVAGQQEVELFSDMTRVGPIFLAVLTIAMRYQMQRYGETGYVGEARLTAVAERLNKWKLIPGRIGRPKRTLAEFFNHLCTAESHSDMTSPGNAIDEAKALLKTAASPLSLKVNFEKSNNQYALTRRDGEKGSEHVLEWMEIDVTGMSTSEFLVGPPPQAQNKRTDSEEDWGA